MGVTALQAKLERSHAMNFFTMRPGMAMFQRLWDGTGSPVAESAQHPSLRNKKAAQIERLVVLFKTVSITLA